MNTKLIYEAIKEPGSCIVESGLIDLNHLIADSLVLTQEEYEEMDEFVNTYKIEGDGYLIYTWNDISGYKYWNLDQQENNYIQVCINITDRFRVCLDKLRNDIQKAKIDLSKYIHEEN